MNKIIHGASCAHVHANINKLVENVMPIIIESQPCVLNELKKELIADIELDKQAIAELNNILMTVPEVPKINWNV